MSMDFEMAVTELVEFTPVKEIAGQAKKELGRASDCRRVFAYLHKARGVAYEIIQKLVNEGLLQQEEKTNNAVFIMRDEHGERVGAELEGTLSERRFKGVEAGSKYGYGFNLRYGSEVRYTLFFESAVDLISFVDLKTGHHKKNLDGCLLVSMAGLKINVLEHMAATFGGLPVLCIDNDPAADEFIIQVTAKGIRHRTSHPDTQYKDWNEELQARF
jgi:hypothetical protein